MCLVGDFKALIVLRQPLRKLAWFTSTGAIDRTNGIRTSDSARFSNTMDNSWLIDRPTRLSNLKLRLIVTD